MTVLLLAKGSNFATFEILNENIFYQENKFSVFLNGKKYNEYTENCFTLYDLEPNFEYEVDVFLEEKLFKLNFHTEEQSVCLDVCDFGAVGDGVFDCTSALQAAICSCPKGGVIKITKGTYYTYPLFLKDDITIFLEENATLLGGTDRTKYPILPGMISNAECENRFNLGTWEGNPMDCYASLFTGIGNKNVIICGKGTLNGNAINSDWWINHRMIKGAWRPRVIFLNNCNDVKIVGITLENSPSWTLHPYYSDNIDILDIKVKNPSDSPNTDGIDPESCENVRIIGANISVGDDCIVIKSGKIYMSEFRYKPSNNILVRNCLLERGHGAVVVGSEISSGVTNLCVSNCLMRDTDRGLRVKTRRGRGNKSIVDNIFYENIIMQNVLTPFTINMFYFCDPDGKSEYVYSKKALKIDERTPYIGNIHLNNITVTNASYAAMFFYGLKEQPIENIEISNVFVDFDKNAQVGFPAMMSHLDKVQRAGIIAKNVKRLVIDNVIITNYLGDKLILENVREIKENVAENENLMSEADVVELLTEYVDYLIDNSDAENPMWNIEQVLSSEKNKWNYVDGCMISALLALYKKTHEQKYLDFTEKFMGYYVKDDGSINTYEVSEYNIDNVNPAKNLFFLYEITTKEKYRKAIDTVYEQIKTMPRTKENNFWHKKIYENQVWLDGLYMAQPFYMEYETKYNGKKGCLDSYTQFKNVEKFMKDPKTGLYYHGYDSSRKMFWANKETGCSENFWLRALGWFAVSLVDVLEVMDEQLYYEKQSLRGQLKDLVDSLLKYQDEQGMFYQVIDKPEEKGNYLETSGTMLISFAILKGVRLGFLPKKYYEFGEKAFYGTANRYLKVDEDGKPLLGGICLVAGLGGTDNRDGSYEYYISEPVVINEAKGVAPMVLAFTEILQS